MPIYISLIQFTQQGIEHMKDSPARLEKARAAVKAAGGEIKEFYLTLGRYDAVVVSEASSNEAYAKTMLAIAAGGAVRTETLCAFPEGEYRKIVAG
jgi:uncharacterized protein with GYD domain